MKLVFLLLVLMFSSNSYACFGFDSGIYEQNWNDSVSQLFISFIVGLIATFIRYIQKTKRLYVPILIFMVTYTPAVLEMIRYGSGDCGESLLQVAKWPTYIMPLVLAYEVFMLVKSKVGIGNT